MRILFLLLVVSSSIFAMNIGVVDSEYIFNQYNKRVKMEADLEEKRVSLNNEIETLRKTLLLEEKQIKSKSNLTEKDKEAILNLKKQYQDKIQESEKNFQEEVQKFFYNIKFEIDSVAALIGKEKGIDMIIEKNATIYGGVDLTEDVLQFLNSTQSYELDTKKILKKEF